ncbi:P3 protein [Chionoecetes opilio]|uniref:P3 protein n=1 Tax=Chionoecetes opilio TaxID=41210 RepID=A0A8J5BXD3_CHIOP|nr:P3 protein [Chionoecetes opilio]
MCPLYPVHLVLMYGGLVVCVWLAGLGTVLASAAEVAQLSVRLTVNDTLVDTLDLQEGDEKMVTFYLDDLPPQAVGEVLIKDENSDQLNHIEIVPQRIPLATLDKEDSKPSSLSGSFNVSGKFLGFTGVRLVLSDGNDRELMASQPVKVKVQRGQRVLDKIFIHVVILMVIVAYINMGCAIDLKVSYLIGYGLFYDSPAMWLGLFLTGCSPGGGGSNIWTYLLGGSLDLSVTMTFVSTVGAFAALPIWVYSLAPTIIQDGHFTKLPYKNIAMLAIGLVVPLSIGLLIKWKSERTALVLKRLLKPFSIIFIVFIMTFGVAVAGLLLPWLGFVFGAVVSAGSHRTLEEIIAISIETGVQNTGISIGILKVALQDYAPLGDIAMVIPVAVATMTPVPLTLAYIIRRVQECRGKAAQMKVDVPFDDNDNHALNGTITPLHKSTSDSCKPVLA